MYKICKTEDAANRQREFEYCLLRLMGHKAYADISVTELCEEIGIGRKNFYRYFNSKEDVLCGLIDHTLQDYIAYLPQNFDMSAWGASDVESYLAYWQKNAGVLDVLDKNGISARLIERVLLYVFWKQPDFQKKDQVLHLMTERNRLLYAITGMMTLIIAWHHSGFRQSREELAKEIAHLLKNTISI